MKTYLDMSRANLFYISGLGILMLTSVLQANLPYLTLSYYIEFEHQRYAAASLLGAATLLGMLCVSRYQARIKEPWRVPQSQVSITYLIFLVIGILGVIASR